MAPVIEELAPVPDPVRCCEQLDGLPYRLFLDSAAPGARLGRYSYVMADPVAVVRTRGDRAALASVRQLLAPHRAAAVDGLPPFQGGAAGYLAYDWGLTLERLPAPRFDDLGLDDVVIGLYDWVLAWDHVAGKAWLISTGIPAAAGRGATRAAERAAMVKETLVRGCRPLGLPQGEPKGPQLRTDAESAPSYPVAGEGALRSSFTRRSVR